MRDEHPLYVAANELIVKFCGQPLMVLTALEVVVGQQRNFVVDHSVLPQSEKPVSMTENLVYKHEKKTKKRKWKISDDEESKRKKTTEATEVIFQFSHSVKSSRYKNDYVYNC